MSGRAALLLVSLENKQKEKHDNLSNWVEREKKISVTDLLLVLTHLAYLRYRHASVNGKEEAILVKSPQPNTEWKDADDHKMLGVLLHHANSRPSRVRSRPKLSVNGMERCGSFLVQRRGFPSCCPGRGCQLPISGPNRPR